MIEAPSEQLSKPRLRSEKKPPSRESLVQAAIECLQRGLSIILVRGKKRAHEWAEFQKRRMSEAELRQEIASRGGVNGIGVVLGQVSGGLCCRDFDVPGAYEKWAESESPIAKRLPTVRTARGMHVYFLASPSL